MKTYRVKVNGTSYEVEIEEMSASEAAASGKAASSAAPSPKASPAAQLSQPVAAQAAAAGGEKITSPMPGNILDVRVKDGQSVGKGDVLFILEAMKMENEIMAPCAGIVSAVSVSQGDTVETGALLCVVA